MRGSHLEEVTLGKNQVSDTLYPQRHGTLHEQHDLLLIHLGERR